MAKDKKSFIAYCDWLKTFEELSDEEAGKLVKHLFRYVSDEHPEAPDKLTKMCFIPFQQTLQRDLKKYNGFIEKQRENGSKGGRPPKPKKPKPLLENPTEPKKAVSDSDSDSDSVSVSVSDTKEKKKEKVYSSAVHACLEKCLTYFPEHLLPKGKKEISAALDTIDKLERIDGLVSAQIEAIVMWARNDNFWSGQFLTINKLRKKNKDGIMYAVVFYENIKSKIKKNGNSEGTIEQRKEVVANYFREKYG